MCLGGLLSGCNQDAKWVPRSHLYFHMHACFTSRRASSSWDWWSWPALRWAWWEFWQSVTRMQSAGSLASSLTMLPPSAAPRMADCTDVLQGWISRFMIDMGVLFGRHVHLAALIKCAWMQTALCSSLEQAGISAEEVNYVNAHATCTQLWCTIPKSSRSTASCLHLFLQEDVCHCMPARLELSAAGKEPDKMSLLYVHGNVSK